MLVFGKARRRVSPALRQESTPSEKRVARALVDARVKVERWIERNETSLMDAIAHRPWTTVADMIPDEPWYEFQEFLQDELTVETIDAGHRAVDGPVGKAKTPLLGYRFDATRPEASSWAAREAGNMVTEITTGQRELIRDLVSRGQVEGITVDQTARTIRQTVGLTTQQAGWVDNFYARNLTQGITAGMSPAQAAARASAATSRYHDRIHRYRAETIARTEVARAASQGRQLAWNQGIEQGFISGQAQKEWIAEFDACEICAPRNGTRHPVGQPWPGGEPPAHPNCRCDLLLIPEPVSGDFSQLSDAQLVDTIAGLIAGPPAIPIAPQSVTELPDDLRQRFAADRVVGNIQGDIIDWMTDQGIDSTLVRASALGDAMDDAIRNEVISYREYVSAGFERMNNALRSGVRDPIADAYSTSLSSYIETVPPLPSAIRVYRGVRRLDDLGIDLTPGAIFTEKGFMSTAVARSSSNTFAGNAEFVITAPKGSRAIVGSRYEAEVIFGPGTKLRITNVDNSSGRTVIECEIIP